jgi:hypothetical protein
MIVFAAPFVPAHPAEAPRTAARLIATLFLAVGGIAPLLVVIAAFAASPDAALRAQAIVAGLERIVVALSATAALGLLYTFGFAAGRRFADPEPSTDAQNPASALPA